MPHTSSPDSRADRCAKMPKLTFKTQTHRIDREPPQEVPALVLKGFIDAANYMGFEKALERADGGLKLDESLALFEEGVQLSESAAKELDVAQQRVEQLLPDGTTAVLQPGNSP